MRANLHKIYWIYFLSGFVLWYGIEKLFMQHIGISAVGIGWAAIVLQGFNVLLDIPTGILADRWSRKGMLLVSSTAMVACCLMMGSSSSLGLYLFGVVAYSLHIVSLYTTADALQYDTLAELGEAAEYDKASGHAGLLNLSAYAAGSVISGFLSEWIGFRATFFLAVVPSVICAFIVMTLKEPSIHKETQGNQPVKTMLTELVTASRAVGSIGLLRALITIMCLLWMVEAFKEGFGQLYMLRYISSPLAIGILWGVFYIIWGIGEKLSSRFREHIDGLMVATVSPLVLMSFVDSWLSLILFMVQAFSAGALFVQITTRIHDETPSNMRASVMSVRTFIGRMVTLPAIYAIGWLTSNYDILWALRLVTVAAAIAAVVWIRHKYTLRAARTAEQSA